MNTNIGVLPYSRDIELPGLWPAESSSEPHEAVLSHEKVDPLDTLAVFLQPGILVEDSATSSIVSSIDVAGLMRRDTVVLDRVNRETEPTVHGIENVINCDERAARIGSWTNMNIPL